jgi:sodium-dependent phosphate cotransporter
MVSSLQQLGEGTAETILLATSNPFTGLFIGLLVTAMIQSSSTTTAMVVALVASGSITLESAVPIIMGANVGTTITSTIVSLGFINKRKEFKRAVSAGTYHDFFNILTVITLFPLEYYYQFLSGISAQISSLFFTTEEVSTVVDISPLIGFGGLVGWIISSVPYGFFVTVLAFVLLFSSILLFRKLISDLLLERSHENPGQFFFKSQAKSFTWGLVTTAAIRSSTITTSLVVPLVAKRIISLKQAAPFILGANIGTTITAFIAALVYTNTFSALTIAIVHFLFNFIGFLIFYPIPVLRKIPLNLADFLGGLTLKYRVVGFVYLLATFFIIPFSLIYLNRDSIEAITVVYETRYPANPSVQKSKIVSRINLNTKSGQWIEYNPHDSNIPAKIYPLHFQNNLLFVENTIFMFGKPGVCWDGEDGHGKYQCCITTILPSFEVLPSLKMDSVYVYSLKHYGDTLHRTTTLYLNSQTPVILKQEIRDSTGILETKRIVIFRKD